MVKKQWFVVYLIGILMFVGCSQHGKLLKSSDNDLKYEAAIAYFNDKSYFRSLQLFEQLASIYKGTVRGEKINFYTAYCYYEQNDYILANYYFARFAKSFPTSSNAEEATYMAAYCTYLQSPRYSLDQTPTYEAIEEMQAFINRYPNSEKVAECNENIDKMREKLQKKAYEVAMLYLKMEDYEAAVFSFNNLLSNFPDTEYYEECLFHITESYYLYAIKSIKHKKKERFQEAIDAYNLLIVSYPESDYRDKVEEMNFAAIEYITNN